MPTRRVLLGLSLGVLTLPSACATSPMGSSVLPSAWSRGLEGTPTLYSQTCTLQPLACLPVATTGEMVAPSSVVMSAAEILEGGLILKDFLDEAEVAHVEEVLVSCAKEADARVNEREYGPGQFPSDEECRKVTGHDLNGQRVTRAMELGTMKHDVAFACVERQLGKQLSDHLKREPRYGKKPNSEKYTTTDEEIGSLVPDIVLHMSGNANKIQFIYDFLFPCTSTSKSDPLGYQRQVLGKKLGKYQVLAGPHQRGLVTPQLGVSR